MQLKNHLVSDGGWRVVASYDGASNYEYEGVTGGGSYGGSSTGPYDVWADTGDVRRVANGSGPGWVMLESPTSEAYGKFHILLAMEGTSDISCGYFACCNEKLLEPVPNYLPTFPSGSKHVYYSRSSFYLMYSGTFTTVGYLSCCQEDGSFVYMNRNTVRTFQTGYFMFSTLDLNTVPENVMPIAIGLESGNGIIDSLYSPNWKGDETAGWPEESSNYYVSGGLSFGWPTRDSGTALLVTDYNPTNFEGDVQLFPLYLLIINEYNNKENVRGLLGRVPDFFICSTVLKDDTKDVLVDGVGNIEYLKAGDYLLIPGDQEFP